MDAKIKQGRKVAALMAAEKLRMLFPDDIVVIVDAYFDEVEDVDEQDPFRPVHMLGEDKMVN